MILTFLEWDGIIDSVQLGQFHPTHEESGDILRCGSHSFRFIFLYSGF